MLTNEARRGRKIGRTTKGSIYGSSKGKAHHIQGAACTAHNITSTETGEMIREGGPMDSRCVDFQTDVLPSR